MSRPERRLLTIHLEATLTEDLRRLASNSGCTLEDLLAAAAREYLDNHGVDGARPHVMAAFANSLDTWHELYAELAK